MESLNVGNRIAFICQSLFKGKTDMARFLNEQPQNIHNWIRRGTNLRTLEYISARLPQVNRDWLMNGVGEPFNNDATYSRGVRLNDEPKAQPAAPAEEPASTLEALTTANLNLTQVVLLQQQKIKELEAELARLRAEP